LDNYVHAGLVTRAPFWVLTGAKGGQPRDFGGHGQTLGLDGIRGHLGGYLSCEFGTRRGFPTRIKWGNYKKGLKGFNFFKGFFPTFPTFLVKPKGEV